MQGVFDLENFLEVHSIHLQHPGGLRSKHEKAYGHRGEKISIFQSHMQSAVSHCVCVWAYITERWNLGLILQTFFLPGYTGFL